MLKRLLLVLSLSLWSCQPVDLPEPQPSEPSSGRSANPSLSPTEQPESASPTKIPLPQISLEPSEDPSPEPTPMNLPVEIVAGNGQREYRDGPAMEASFLSVLGMCTDPQSGDIYLSDTHKIRKLSPDGHVSTLAGQAEPGFADGPASEALFDTLYGCTVDDQGNLYVVDRGNQRIRKLSSDGEVSTLTGPGEDKISDTVVDVAWLPEQGVFISEEYEFKRYYNGRFELLSTDTPPSYQTGPVNTISLGNRTFLASDGQENIYFGDRENKNIRHYNSKTQEVSMVIDLKEAYLSISDSSTHIPWNSYGIALDPKLNNIFLVGSNIIYGGQDERTLRWLAPQLDAQGHITGTIFGQIDRAITVDLAHKVYVYDYGSRQIKRISPPLKEAAFW